MYPFDSYPTALELVASGRVDVKPLITHTYKLEETLQAFERAKTGEGGTIKVRGEGGEGEGGRRMGMKRKTVSREKIIRGSITAKGDRRAA